MNAARIRRMEDEIDARLDKAEQRLTKVEGDIEHGPSRDDLKRIHERVDDTAREVHEMTGEFRSVKVDAGADSPVSTEREPIMSFAQFEAQHLRWRSSSYCSRSPTTPITRPCCNRP